MLETLASQLEFFFPSGSFIFDTYYLHGCTTAHFHFLIPFPPNFCIPLTRGLFSPGRLSRLNNVAYSISIPRISSLRRTPFIIISRRVYFFIPAADVIFILGCPLTRQAFRSLPPSDSMSIFFSLELCIIVCHCHLSTIYDKCVIANAAPYCSDDLT